MIQFRRNKAARRLTWMAICLTLGAQACGGANDEEPLLDSANNANNTNNVNNVNGVNNLNNTNNANNVNDNRNSTNNVFVPEVEEFLVRQVAATDSYVFVPNEAEESNTVARIDGVNLSVLPIQVGQNPDDVVAAETEDQGAIAYVLCEGSSVVAVIRADKRSQDGLREGDVRLLPVPDETNSLALAPGGRHAIAYIDPNQDLEDSRVASLQALSLVRLGDEAGEDEVYDLSVTRVIRDLEFTENGELFIVGREGVNRLRLADINADALIPRLDLGLDDSLFPPTDLEIEVAPDASFMVVRSSSFAGIAIYDLPTDTSEVGERRLIGLDDIPTDIDLVATGVERKVIVSVRDANQIVLVDVIEALGTPVGEEIPTTILEVATKDAGLAQLTPNQELALLYSTIVEFPTLSLLDISTGELESYGLRNQIRSVAVAPDNQTAIVVHQPDPTATGSSPENVFRRLNALTLFDIPTGYRRPVILEGSPIDILMTETSTEGESVVFVLLGGEGREGVMRLELPSFRTDVIDLPLEPRQIGRVAGQVFVSQESEQGRITFFDIDTGEQRTVSGYELNAEID